MQAAAEYPDVTFVACTGDMAAASTPNTANIFPYTFQSRYVSGVVAGMKLKELMDAGTVTDPYVGYVGAYPMTKWFPATPPSILASRASFPKPTWMSSTPTPGMIPLKKLLPLRL